MQGQHLLQNLNFLCSGIVQNLLAFELDTVGLGAKSANNLLATAQPLGSVILCLCFTGNFQRLRTLGLKQIFTKYWLIALCDTVGGICTQASIALIGSGIFTVIFSSIVVYIATLNRIKFHRDVSKLRWGALLIITSFVIVSAGGAIKGGSNFLDTLLGICFALGATFGYGTVYVLLNDLFEKDKELALRTNAPRISQTFLLLCVALIETFANLLYFVCVVIPMWTPWVAEPMKEKNTSLGYGFLLFILLVVVDGSHMIGFYFCTSFGKVAATSSGVNKALQAAILFVCSHYIFCSSHQRQCMNTGKTIGTIGVVCGVLLYALDTKVVALFGGTGGTDEGGEVIPGTTGTAGRYNALNLPANSATNLIDADEESCVET